MAADVEGGTLFGRAEELAELRSRIDDLARGRGAMILVGGEPGIGKTRLAIETASWAERAGVAVAWGLCPELGSAPSLWPWAQALHTVAPGVLEGLIGSEPAHEPSSGDASDSIMSASRRFRAFRAVTDALVDRAPLVLVLDDVHRADEGTLALLAHVLGVLPLTPLLLVATFRDAEVAGNGPLTRFLATTVDEPCCRYLELRPLDRSAMLAWARATTPSSSPAPADLEAIVARSGGNPFFVEELVRAGGPQSSLPRSVQHVVGRRLAALPPRTLTALEALAVLGRETELTVLAAVLGRSSAVVERDLRDAVEARLVDVERSTVRLHHALVGEVLLEGLDPGRRGALHARAVDVLAALPSGDSHLDAIAHHALDAETVGAYCAAAPHVLAAGRRRERSFAFEDAARMYERALSLPSGAELRTELLAARGEALARSGDVVAARRCFDDLADEAVGDPPMLARAALGLASCVVSAGTVDWRVVGRLEQAILAADDLVAVRARLRARLGIELYWHQGGNEARTVTATALHEAEASEDPDSILDALHARLFSLRGAGSLDERLAIGDRLVSMAARVDRREAEIRGLVWWIPELLQAGDLHRFRMAVARLGRLAEDSGLLLHAWYARLFDALEATMAGNVDEAERLSAIAADAGLSIGAEIADAYRVAQRVLLARDVGGLADVEAPLRRAIESFPAFVTLRGLLALVLVELGRRYEAHVEITSLAANAFTSVPTDSLRLATIGLVAETAAAIGDTDVAVSAAAELLPHRGTCIVQGLPTCLGAADHALGLVLDATGDVEGALSALTAATRLHEQWGMPALAARSRLARADVLRKRSDPGDEVLALDDIATAVAIATRTRLGRLVEIAAAAAQPQPTAQAAILGPGGALSPREREVLALVATGASNNTIAHQLTVSLNTVERHLSNIFTKLGVRSRAAAAAYAIRNGLDS